MSITCRTSLVRQAPGKYETATVEVDDPRQDEIRVKMVASGLCHSDDHIATGDIPVGTYPFAGGHEGGGIVESVGPNTKGFEVGDKVVFSFLPACGQCRWCATGHSNLCDLGAGLLAGTRWDDPSTRLHLEDGTNVGQMCGIGDLLRVLDRRGRLGDQGPAGHQARGRLPARLLGGHRLGHRREHRRGRPRRHRDHPGHRRHRRQRRPGRGPRGRGQRHRRRPRRVQAREGPRARRHRGRRVDRGGHRARPRATRTARAPTSRSSRSASPSPSTSATPSPRSASRARSSSPASATSPRWACRSRSAS